MRICERFDVQPGDIMEYIPDKAGADVGSDDLPGGILMSLRLQLRVSLCVDVAPLR